MRRIETYGWWQELVNKKDELSLRELAERFDVTPGAISAAFKRTGLSRKAAPPGPRIRRKSQSNDDLPPEPGEMDDEDDSSTSAEARPGSKDTRILPYLEMLGKVPDSEVARKAGVSVRTIASFRARNQLNGYKGPRKRGADRAPRKSRIDAFSHLVGQLPDRAVAQQAGVSLNAVRNWRMRHNMLPNPQAEESEFTPASVSSHSAGSGAWRVVTGSNGAVRVVIAGSLSDAAARVEDAGIGRILALEWIGETL